MKQTTLAIILITALGCTSKNNDNSSSKTSSINDCQAGLDYYKANNIKVIETKAEGSITFSGEIVLSGKGIISAKPALYICDDKGAVTIAGMGDIKIDKNNSEAALKILTPIFLIKTNSFYPSESQKAEFQKRLLKPQLDSSEWTEMIEDQFVFRGNTIQADARGNYFFVIHTGNRKSWQQ